MKYNYVYLNTSYISKGRLDQNEYNSICLRDVCKHKQVQVIQTPLDYSNILVRRLFNLTRIIDGKTNLHFIYGIHT